MSKKVENISKRTAFVATVLTKHPQAGAAPGFCGAIDTDKGKYPPTIQREDILSTKIDGQSYDSMQ